MGPARAVRWGLRGEAAAVAAGAELGVSGVLCVRGLCAADFGGRACVRGVSTGEFGAAVCERGLYSRVWGAAFDGGLYCRTWGC